MATAKKKQTSKTIDESLDDWTKLGEYLPTDDFLEALKSSEENGSVQFLNLCGVEVITDEVFHMLLSEGIGGNIKHVSCLGCVHITDFGISLLAEACPQLAEVYLDGCRQLTSKSLHALGKFCKSLTLVRMCCTSVTHIPLTLPRRVKVTLEGCPLIVPTLEGRLVTVDEHSASHKLIILSSSTVKFSMLDFLRNGKLQTSEAVASNMMYERDVVLEKVEKFRFNVFEFHTDRQMSVPYVTERAAVMFVMDIQKDTSDLLPLMTTYTEVHGHALHTPLHVLFLHDGKEERRSQIENMCETFIHAIDQQDENYDTKEDSYSYDKKNNDCQGERDFLFQVRYMRSLEHARNLNIIRIFSLNTENGEIEQVYPKQEKASNASTGGDTTENDQNEDDNWDGILEEISAGSLDVLEKQKTDLMATIDNLVEQNNGIMEAANQGMNGVAKKDLSEIKAFKSPPAAALDAVATVATLFGKKKNDWATAKVVLGEDFLLKIKDFDKDNISKSQIRILEKYTSDINNEPAKVKNTSSAAGSISQWLHALHEYSIAVAPITEAKTKLELINQRIEKAKDWKSLISTGPLLMKVMLAKDMRVLQNEMYPHLRIPKSGLIDLVQSVAMELKSERVITLYNFIAHLQSKEDVNSGAVKKVLEHLNLTMENKRTVTKDDKQVEVQDIIVQANADELLLTVWDNASVYWKAEKGDEVELYDVLTGYNRWYNRSQMTIKHEDQMKGDVLYFPRALDQPVVTDVSFFFRIQNSVTSLKENQQFLNKGRVRFLGDDVPVFQKEEFFSIVEDCKPQEGSLIFEVLEEQGLFIKIPKMQMRLERTQKQYYFCYANLNGKTEEIFLRDSAFGGTYSTSEFKESSWKPNKDRDVVLEYSYKCKQGMPVNILPRVIAECIQMGCAVHIHKNGCIIRHAAVEIQVELVNSALEKSIDMTLKTMQDETHPVMQEYAWNVFSYYLLVVENELHRYPHLSVQVRQPCQAKCSDPPHMYSPCMIPRRLDYQLTCPSCKDMSKDRANILTGRQRFSPFHSFVDTTNPRKVVPNPHTPYSYGDLSDDEDENFKCCVCTLTLDASTRLWEKESSLYPSFASTSLKLPQQDQASGSVKKKPVLELKGNLLECTQAAGSVFQDHVAVFAETLVIFGFIDLSITVFNPGKITIAMGLARDTEYTSIKDMGSRAHIFSLDSGLLEARSDDGISSETYEPIKQHETFSFKARQNLETENNEKKAMSLIKNGSTFAKVSEISGTVAIILQPDEQNNLPGVIVHCPTHPVIRSHDFQLGSALFYKLQKSQQWALGQVLATEKCNVIVGDRFDPESAETFHPASEDILPFTSHKNSGTVIVGKEILKNRSEYSKWMTSRDAWPAANTLFSEYRRDKSNFGAVTLDEFTFDQYICMESRHSPQVLYTQAYKLCQKARRKASGPEDVCKMMLPNFTKERIRNLYNPYISVVNDVKNQSLHTICVGTALNGIDILSCLTDAHFLGIPPQNLSEREATALRKTSVEGFINNLISMQNIDGVFVPYEGVPEVDANEFEFNLKKYIDMYLAAHILLQWLYQCNKSKVSALDSVKSEMSASAEDEDLRQRLLAVDDEPKSEDDSVKRKPKRTVASKKASKKKALCLSHQNKENIIVAKEEHSKGRKWEYAEQVKSVVVKNSPLKSDFVQSQLSTFTNLLVLNLQGSRLTEVRGISSCPNLVHIDLARNRLTKVPEEIQHLSKTLKCLDISENPIQRFPEFITSLTSLVRLCATYIRELPEDFGQLRLLHTLYLKQTMLTELPQSFSNLWHLEDLVLDGVPLPFAKRPTLIKTNWMSLHSKNNGLVTYGVSLVWWEKFYDKYDVKGDKILDGETLMEFTREMSDAFPRLGQKQSDNGYGGFPPQILELKRLERIDVQNQAFIEIPDEISRLQKLVLLNVSGNMYLESLSSETGKLNKLRELTVKYCPRLRTPPPEIVAQGNNHLIAYLKRLSQGSVSCYRTKLMFVGLGGAGKTSLMRALMSADGRCPETKGEAITDGIDINTWTLPFKGNTYTFSVWDFAGQTIYYNTHQFFLSKRAVYMLVWNTRLGYEHSGLDFWLASIACHTPKAPIFIIGTHLDKISKSDLPMNKLKERFPNIVSFVTVSSHTGQGVNELRSQFLEVTHEQPYMGEKIPEAWLHFERLILSERSKTSLLSWSEVVTIAEMAAVSGAEIRRAALFLHELGTLQYFDNKLLRDRVVINPQWIVDVMACIVSVHNTPVKNGILQHKDIGKVWKDYPKNLRDWLLRLTEVFDLTFPLPDKEENIVPCLLPQNVPEFEWPKVGGDIMEMKMVYKFEYLPAGLFNRSQVRLYEYSESKAMWKEGSILKKNENIALFKQTSENEILVKVAGPRPENVLLMVHEVVEGLIVEFFQGVKYEYHIPCVQCIKTDMKDPAMFPSRVLNRAIQMKALYLQCHAFFHTLSISEVQALMPPISNTDYALQLENALQELDNLQGDLESDVFVMYCNGDVPTNVMDENVLHPKRLVTDLQTAGFKCWYDEELAGKPVNDVMMAMRNSKRCLVLISDALVADPHCQRLFHFMMNNLRTEYDLLMVGKGREWQQSDIGMKVVHDVFINFQRMGQYQDKLQILTNKLNESFMRGNDVTDFSPDVFLSYCWSNSRMSVEEKIAREKDGSVGAGDPREIKEFLEANGINVWLDLEQAGKNGLFEDIAAGMRRSKVVVACISDEYVLSRNCQMEFRFAHVALCLPVVVAVVGSGLKWEATEIGMLSLGYPKVSFLVANNFSHNQLLEHVQEHLDAGCDRDIIERPLSETPVPQKELAFQELYELAQRKFLRQISSYLEPNDPYPRLFVVDLNYDPETKSEENCADIDDMKIGIDYQSDPEKNLTLDYLDTGMFCIKTLCEYEGGWHVVSRGMEVQLGGNDLLSVWQMAAPYMARILAILKHSSVNLHILLHPEGYKVLKLLEKKSSLQPQVDLKPLYMILRKFVIMKDSEQSRGGLSRCYLPSGKVLWLCPEHQNQTRITVLTEDGSPEFEADPSETPEDVLLAGLTEVTSASTDKNFEALQDLTEKKEVKPRNKNKPKPTEIKTTTEKPNNPSTKEVKLRNKNKLKSTETNATSEKPNSPLTKEVKPRNKNKLNLTETKATTEKPNSPLTTSSNAEIGEESLKTSNNRETERETSPKQNISAASSRKGSALLREKLKYAGLSAASPSGNISTTSQACILL